MQWAPKPRSAGCLAPGNAGFQSQCLALPFVLAAVPKTHKIAIPLIVRVCFAEIWISKADCARSIG